MNVYVSTNSQKKVQKKKKKKKKKKEKPGFRNERPSFVLSSKDFFQKIHFVYDP